MLRRRRTKLPFLFAAAGAVFVAAVFWLVLPRGRFDSDTTDRLRTQLAEERAVREKELQAELEGLREENRRLRKEIERFEGSAIE